MIIQKVLGESCIITINQVTYIGPAITIYIHPSLMRGDVEVSYVSFPVFSKVDIPECLESTVLVFGVTVQLRQNLPMVIPGLVDVRILIYSKPVPVASNILYRVTWPGVYMFVAPGQVSPQFSNLSGTFAARVSNVDATFGR